MQPDNWTKITNDALKVGARDMLFIRDYNKAEKVMKLRKKHPELAKRIDDYLDDEDPFIEHLTAIKSHDRWSMFFVVVGILFIIVNAVIEILPDMIPPVFFIVILICSFLTRPKDSDFDFKKFGIIDKK